MARKRRTRHEDDCTDISDSDYDLFPFASESGEEVSPSKRGNYNKLDNSTPRGRARGRGTGSRRRGRTSGTGRGGSRGRGTGRGDSRERAARRNLSESYSDCITSLYEKLRSGKESVSSVVNDWMDNYKLDKDSAILDLTQLFIECASCKGRITAEMQQSLNHNEIIQNITDQFKEQTVEHSSIISGPLFKKFNRSYCEFLVTLVQQCPHSILFDKYLLDNIITFLTSLSDSVVPAFRHTATLAVMKLMTALYHEDSKLKVMLDNTKSQYRSSELRNIRDARTTEMLEMLKTKIQKIQDNVENIKGMLSYMFKSIFVIRYRDTLPNVRSICISEIGLWMRMYPDQFLTDLNLKYIWWTMHDKVAVVRLKCLEVLLPLYSSRELTSKMLSFTNKSKNRIIEMTLDIDGNVSVCAIKIIFYIRQHFEVLNNQDLKTVYQLVYSSHRPVAKAAGDFLNKLLFDPEEIVQSLRDLIQFFLKSKLKGHGPYLVDSLIDFNPMMKDWDCMTELLLKELGEEGLGDRQETSLIEIMVCCIKQSATGEPPVGRGPNRKNVSTKEQKQIADDRVKLTGHFIQTLPPLLGKYIADDEKVAKLIIIPQYFDLEIYATSRHEECLDQLLKQMRDIFTHTHNMDVLEACAKTYAALCNEDLVIHSRCAVEIRTLVGFLIRNYQSVTNRYVQLQPDEIDEVHTFQDIKVALEKITVIYHCHDLGPFNIWKPVFETWVKTIVNNEERPPLEDVAKQAINCCHVGLFWERLKLEGSSPDSNVVNLLAVNLREYMLTMRQIMNTCHKSVLQEEAYISICDNLMNYSKLLTETSKALQPLVCEPDQSLVHELVNFLKNKVFIEEDDDDEQDEHAKIEELRKRRNYLASFCKLVVYNVLPIKTAYHIFKNYHKFYKNYGTIIRETIDQALEINRVICAKTMVLSLVTLFDELPLEISTGVVNNQTKHFISIIKLAKKFAFTLGLDRQFNKKSVMAIHREGILYSLKDDGKSNAPNVDFLEMLSEFSHKLTKPDRRVILDFMEENRKKTYPRGTLPVPLINYSLSLTQTYDNDEFDESDSDI